MIILGAGFSRAAGLPLGPELSQEVLKLADTRTFSVLNDDIERFRRYQLLRTGICPSRTCINVEDLLAYLDIEHHLRLLGSDTWSDQGNKGQLALRALIGKVIVDRQAAMSAAQWEPYLLFAQNLAPNDQVITFNYDTILETACERVGKAFRLCPHRFKLVHDGGGILDQHRQEVIIRKVHGSVDWYDMTAHLQQSEHQESSPTGRPTPWHNAIIARQCEELQVVPLVEQPYPDGESLTNMVRAKNIAQLSSADGLWPVPMIIAPSSAKIVYLNQVRELWHGMGGVGRFNSQMMIIGFSFPSHDDYALVPLISAIDAFQSDNQTLDYFDASRLKVIDYQQGEVDQTTFKERLRWIDWSKVDAFWGGFNAEIIPRIFEPNKFRRQA